MHNDFYVYLHRKASTGDVFYVGKGRHKRAWNKTHRNEYWKRIEKKHGRVVEIAFSNLSEDEAFRIEIDTIEKYGISNLSNACTGGLGGRKASEETRMKQSLARKGRKLAPETIEKIRAKSLVFRHSDETKKKLSQINTGRSGHKHTDETKQKIREAMKAREIKPEWCAAISAAKKGKPGIKKTPEQAQQIRERMIGNILSKETKDKISAANKGRKHTQEAMEKIIQSNRLSNAKRKKPVLCSNGMMFDSPNSAADWLRSNGIQTAVKSNIVSCCKGRLKTAYGFVWSHAKDELEE